MSTKRKETDENKIKIGMANTDSKEAKENNMRTGKEVIM